MILVLEPGLDLDAVHRVEAEVRRAGGEPRRLRGAADGIAREAIEVRGGDAEALTSLSGVAMVLEPPSPYPRVAREGHAKSKVSLGRDGHRVDVGGPDVVFIAGPCAVEGAEQLEASARAAALAGATVLRGGAYKPRTSPYSFQGLGEEGLALLRAAADRHALALLTEVMEPATVGLVAEYADALQIGSRNMQNFPLLRAAGRQRRPVVLKRGMSATLEEWLLAAEYIADAGNDTIILCERGVRTFDSASRNMLDLAAVPLLRERTHLPIIVDPSHGVGVRAAVGVMTLASVAAGADGIMLECHPDPGCARSDGYQALLPGELIDVIARARKLSEALRA